MRDRVLEQRRAAARVTWAGHSTVVIETGGARLITDPLLRGRLLGFLRRHRGMAHDRVGRLDAVLISHLHLDHLDLRSLRSLGTDVPVVVPPGGARFLSRRGFASPIELAPGEMTTVGGVDVRAVHAEHTGGRLFGRGEIGAGGYVIEGRARIYFAGDTGLFDAMASLAPLDLALLPVWGWAPWLGPGHLDPETAAQALRLLHPRVAIPIHWGTLAPLGARVWWPWMLDAPGARFAASAHRLAPEVHVRVLAPGETVDVSGRADGATL